MLISSRAALSSFSRSFPTRAISSRACSSLRPNFWARVANFIILIGGYTASGRGLTHLAFVIGHGDTSGCLEKQPLNRHACSLNWREVVVRAVVMVTLPSSFSPSQTEEALHSPSGASFLCVLPGCLFGSVSSSSTSRKARVRSKSSASLIQVRPNWRTLLLLVVMLRFSLVARN